jgi:hypothetical protein
MLAAHLQRAGLRREPAACLKRIGKESSMHPDLVVGKHFPDLELPDHRSQIVKLSELAKGFPLIVSFYRGYW